MRIFAGLSRTDYEEVLRAIGALIDERGWRNVTIIEVEEGLALQVMPALTQGAPVPTLETYLLTDSDIGRVMNKALIKRQRSQEQGRAAAGTASIAEDASPVTPPSVTASVAEPNVANGLGSALDGDTDHWQTFAESPDKVSGAAEAVPFDRRKRALPLPDGFVDRRKGGRDVLPAFDSSLAEMTSPERTYADPGVIRAAVVMASIVAARLKSGVPVTSDDPDLTSLLDQVRQLDTDNINEDATSAPAH